MVKKGVRTGCKMGLNRHSPARAPAATTKLSEPPKTHHGATGHRTTSRDDRKLTRDVLRAWRGVLKARQRALNAARRKRRDHLFKANVDRFGLPKAKMIAAIVTRRQKGTYTPTRVSFGRYLARKPRQVARPKK